MKKLFAVTLAVVFLGAGCGQVATQKKSDTSDVKKDAVAEDTKDSVDVGLLNIVDKGNDQKSVVGYRYVFSFPNAWKYTEGGAGLGSVILDPLGDEEKTDDDIVSFIHPYSLEAAKAEVVADAIMKPTLTEMTIAGHKAIRFVQKSEGEFPTYEISIDDDHSLVFMAMDSEKLVKDVLKTLVFQK
jgi:hypothetical protein